MTHEIFDAAGLHDELSNRMRRLELRTSLVFRQALPVAAAVFAATDGYLTRLRCDTPGGGMDATTAAEVLQHELIDPAELGTPAFWATALGRAIGYWTGGHERWTGNHCLGVPQVEAAALLKMSRQGVNDAIGRKRLEQVGAGLGVTASSVVALMHARYPLGTIEILEARHDGTSQAA